MRKYVFRLVCKILLVLSVIVGYILITSGYLYSGYACIPVMIMMLLMIGADIDSSN